MEKKACCDGSVPAGVFCLFWPLLVRLCAALSQLPWKLLLPIIESRCALQCSLSKGQEAGHDGQLVYSVAFNGKAAFENSALGLELANQPTLGSAVHIAGSTPSSGVDDYTLIAGKASAIHDAYNSLTVHAAESASPGTKF